MSSGQVQRQITARDIEILVALDRCPLTVEQLLKLSDTFESHPFTSPRSVQERLQKLCVAGWVRRWRYATTSRGASPHYHKLTLLGYRIVHGENAQPIAKRQFQEIAIARHHHTMGLADFIVHTSVAADRRHHSMQGFYRENTLKLTVGDESLFPDCAFELVSSKGGQFNFLVELDNSTERVRSEKDIESWERKIRFYDELQEKSFPRRFRVLVVTTRSSERLSHILEVARDMVRNPRRSLFYGVYVTVHGLGWFFRKIDLDMDSVFEDDMHYVVRQRKPAHDSAGTRCRDDSGGSCVRPVAPGAHCAIGDGA